MGEENYDPAVAYISDGISALFVPILKWRINTALPM